MTKKTQFAPAAPAPWTQPGTTRRTARAPSWIGMQPVQVPPVVPASLRPAPRMTPPEMAVVRPPSIPAMLAVRPTMPPPSISIAPGPCIQSIREVELEHEVTVLRGEIERLERALVEARQAVLEESEPEVVRLAVAVARRVVGRELETDPGLMLAWIKESLRAIGGGDGAVLAMSPSVGEILLPEELSAAVGERKIVVDESLDPGACQWRETSGSVEVGARARVDALADALGVDPSPGASAKRSAA